MKKPDFNSTIAKTAHPVVDLEAKHAAPRLAIEQEQPAIGRNGHLRNEPLYQIEHLRDLRDVWHRGTEKKGQATTETCCRMVASVHEDTPSASCTIVDLTFASSRYSLRVTRAAGEFRQN